MEGKESGRLPASVVCRVGPDMGPAQIADVILSTWQEMETALSPVIGRGGVAALFRRGHYLACSAHPWLAGAREPVHTPAGLAALRAVLAEQSGAEAQDGGVALLQAFYELLTTLVGSSLTEELLGSVWATSTSHPPAKDPLP